MEMTPADWATLVIAIGGLILGIRSEIRARRHDAVRLRVIPKFAFPVGPMPDPNPCFAFEIINDGFRPVTVSEVGFFFRGTTHRAAITSPILNGDEKWPARLEPHSSTTVYTSSSELGNPRLPSVDCAYVMTASDLIFRGTSPALTHFVQHGQIPTPKRRFARSGMPGYFTVKDFSDGFESPESGK